MDLHNRWTAILVLSAGLTLGGTGAVRAQAPSIGPKIGIGVGASSLGVGADLIVGLGSRFELRGGGNYFKLTRDSTSISDISYNVAAKWVSGALAADLYLAGPLRLTGALLWNGNKLTLDASPSSSVTMGDTTYTASDVGTIHGTVDFKKVVPYLGLGLAGRGVVSPFFQLGLVFQGAPQVGYTTTTRLTGAAKTRFDQEVANEVAKIQSDLNWFKYYPHVALGLTIRP